MLDALVASEGEPDLVQISGGEPTLHPQFLDVAGAGATEADPPRHDQYQWHCASRASPISWPRSPRHKRGLEIYLQFDSLERDALIDMRGADLRAVRQQALENLERHDISTTLVCDVKKGVNDNEMGAIVRHALEWKCVRGVNFQPMQDAGRNENFDKRPRPRPALGDPPAHRRDSGVFGERDMIPLPCNPESHLDRLWLAQRRDSVAVDLAIPQEQFWR